MIGINIDKFFSTARERYQIMLRRQGKLEPLKGCYSEDRIFQKWRFCNTFREDDKTTVWFRQNIRGFLQRRLDDVLFATIAFRWFNRIETGEKILQELSGGPAAWDPEAVRAKLKDAKPVVTGAYIIKTPNGMNKLDGILWCIEKIRKDCDSEQGHGLTYGIEMIPPEERKLEEVWGVLREYPYLGDFMAYQIISDLRHTAWLDKAADAMTWASPGPGSTRGLGWLVENNPNRFSRGNKKDWAEMLRLMQILVSWSRESVQWPQNWPRWEMQTVQHWLCEYDKYMRAAGGQEMKRKFK